MKRTVIRSISRLTWASGLDRLVHMVNRRRGGVILAYHHISGDALERQLALLSRWYAFVSLTEFVSRHRQGRSTNGLMVVTFDDGFGDEVEAAADLAVRRGWPMTFYLPTGYILSGRPYWFIRLASQMQAAPEGSYRVGERTIEIGDAHSRESARRRMAQGLFGRPIEEIEAFIDRLGEILFASREKRWEPDIPAPISPQRVADLAQRAEVAFEAHSVTHPYFSILSGERIREEMEASRRDVEEMTARPVRHFCYPYGITGSIGLQAPELARQLFDSATTAIRARCRPGADRALLPRITMHEHYTPGMTSLKVKAAR